MWFCWFFVVMNGGEVCGVLGCLFSLVCVWLMG